jgi:uncharacterized membrane protein YeaQ/YmgE (transglycosylase-associated protein family)
MYTFVSLSYRSSFRSSTMDLLTLLTIGVLSGQAASLLSGGYSLGALGNSIAGITGALFLGKTISLIFGLSSNEAMVAGGLGGALVILLVFKAAESLTTVKKNRLF